MTAKGRSATLHMCDPDSFVALDSGFLAARCSCGWAGAPVPGPDDVADSLMMHARERALIEDKDVVR